MATAATEVDIDWNPASDAPPPVYSGAQAWRSDEMRTNQDWLFELSEAHVAELKAAADASEARGVPLVSLSKADFALPTLGAELEKIEQDVVHGRGFVLIRGVPVAELTREQAARIYLGIGAWVGDPVPQNAKGHILGHVKDIGQDPTNPHHRVYATNYRHKFHTDSADIVGLLCLQPAKEGGLSYIASSTAVYNRIAETRPDLARVLASPFHIDRKGEIPEGKKATYEMAVCHPYAGHLTTIYARDFIEMAQRFDEVPRLTEAQVEAMDMVDDLCASDEFRLDMDFRPGDIQLIHNHQILHARTGYLDWPEPERRRHLLRLWLSTRDGRPLPPVFEERYGEIRVGHIRGGIRVPGQTLVAPLEAE